MRSTTNTRDFQHAGRPAPGLRPGARRGSALIIVIGTLALISVFAAIYISVGQSDRRSAATVRARADLGELTGAYADHVARVVADDRLDAVMQFATHDRRFQAPRRVTTDAPYTDWTMRSESDEAWNLFSAVGGVPVPVPMRLNSDDPRVPSDPWLASLLPTFLGDPFARPFSQGNPEHYYLDNRDWGHISNVAPDGRFVNLFNLRNNFRAEPGWGTAVVPGVAVSRRLSEDLSLFRQRNPGNFRSAIQSFPIDDGIWLPGATTPVPLSAVGLSLEEARNTPAVWTMHQRFAFLPADQSFVTYNRNGQVSSWADPDYPAYQWADANGDGMYDSRWFELTSARTPHTGTTPREDAQWLYDRSEYRVFGAVRVVDLSAMVNVNTAIDALTPPTEEYPLGLTPAEVDLRRLLTMQDSAVDSLSAHGQTLSLRHAHRPRPIRGTGQQLDQVLESDYSAHVHLPDGGSAPKLDPETSAMRVGRYAAAAVRRGMERHATLGPRFLGVESPGVDPDPLYQLGEGTALELPGRSPLTEFDFYAGGRAETYMRVGRLDPTRLSLAGMTPYADESAGGVDSDYYAASNQTLPFALYGVDDLAELLTFHGLNDPEVTTRLERNMLGRFDGPNGEVRLSPLLANRPLELDRYRHGQYADDPNPNRPRIIDGRIAHESMALFELSPRLTLTPVSGATPLRPMSVVGNTVQSTTRDAAGVAGLSRSEAGVTLSEVAAFTRTGFDVFYNALAGELEMYRSQRRTPQNGPPEAIIENALWPSDLTMARDGYYANYGTLFYGHRGPELAIRAAAHAGANLKDMYDSDREPTIASVVLDNNFGELTDYRNLITTLRDDPQTFSLESNQGRLALFYPGLIGSGRIDLDAPRQWENPANHVRDENQVLPTNHLPERRQAVNVFGVEPMPVITEVASFYLYTDAAVSAGGDADHTVLNPDGGIPPSANIIADPFTLDGSVSDGNSDFLAGVIAFQLHNPFDVAIDLGGGTGPKGVMWRKREQDAGGNVNNFNTNNNLEFNYYIEYNGHYFKLGEFWEFTPMDDTPEGFTLADRQLIQTAGGSLTEPTENERLDPTDPDNYPFQYRSVTLGAGQTRVFYAMFHPRFDWPDRGAVSISLEKTWEDIVTSYGGGVPLEFTDPDNDADEDGLPDGRDGRGWTGLAQEWIENQLRVEGGLRAVRIRPFDPTNGELTLVDRISFNDLIGQPGTTVPDRPADHTQVRLWKKYAQPNYEEITQTEINNGYTNGTRRNLLENDILVDRLYLAEEGGNNYLDVPLEQANFPVNDTVSFPEGTHAFRNDNSGASILRWATVRRRDAPASVTNDAPGRVLPWLVQSRRNRSDTWIRSTNKAGAPDAVSNAVPDRPTFDDFFWTPNGGIPNRVTTRAEPHPDPRGFDSAESPSKMFSAGMGRSGLRVASIGKTPFDKRDQEPDYGDRFPTLELGSNAVGDTLHGSNSPLKPEVFLRKEISAARVGEALLALGIGPTWAPDPSRGLGDLDFEDHEWMTLPEAFAAALGYETFNMGDADEAQAANAVWHDAVRTISGSTTGEYVLDNLRLRLDDYVPFLNVLIDPSESGNTGKPAFTIDPANPTAMSDLRRGAGVPMALGVLDQLRPFEMLRLPGERLEDLSGDLRLTRPVMGLVNVQTAPLRVLRLLPGLTPSAEEYRPSLADPSTRAEWWAATNGLVTADIGVARLSPATAVDNPDAAAGIVAYRDRLPATPRQRSQDPSLQPLSYQPDLGSNVRLYPHNLRTEFTPTPSMPTDRAGIAGIPGLRGTPGFASLGELLAVSVAEDLPTGIPNPRADEWRHLTVQPYFGDGKSLGADGSAANLVTIDPQISNGEVGETEDDYAERLAVAAGIMNTTSVRSDYFAAWLVVQGFRESDVTGLRDEDALVPSFKKRYLMVIDRSNVINPGDSPRIVLFKELPL